MAKIPPLPKFEIGEEFSIVMEKFRQWVEDFRAALEDLERYASLSAEEQAREDSARYSRMSDVSICRRCGDAPAFLYNDRFCEACALIMQNERESLTPDDVNVTAADYGVLNVEHAGTNNPRLCRTCRFWEEKGPAKNDPLALRGVCRRYPPKMNQHRTAATESLRVYTPTWSNDWCGEWEGKGGG